MAVIVGSAKSSYGNTKRGDQNGGRECATEPWYRHSKGWRALRCKDPAKRPLLVAAMKFACASDLFGYSQGDRDALLAQMKQYGYDITKIKDPTNCDCSSLIRACCYHAGIKPSNFITSSEVSALLKTGEFYELKDSKYTTKSDYLIASDILVTKTKGHTVMVLSDGPKAESKLLPLPEVQESVFGDRELQNGSVGADVEELQRILIGLGYSCGEEGVDGEFGDHTELALCEFQRDTGIVVDGICGKETYRTLEMMINADHTTTGTNVVIHGGNCYVRSEPSTEGEKLGVAYNGTSHVFANEVSNDGWLKILFKGTEGWVSGRYADIV